MSLLEKIKADSLTARKERNSKKSALLTTLYSEANIIGINDGHRDTTDAEVVQVVKKFIKGIDETLNAPGRSITLEAEGHKFDIYAEKGWLQAYLPTQMGEDELRKIIKNMAIDNPDISMGTVMSGLKQAYAGQYDGQLASKIAKELLNG